MKQILWLSVAAITFLASCQQQQVILPAGRTDDSNPGTNSSEPPKSFDDSNSWTQDPNVIVPIIPTVPTIPIIPTIPPRQSLPDQPQASQDCVNYEEDIQPIIQNNCLRCHGGLYNPNLSSLGNQISSLGSLVVASITSGSMPTSGPLSQAQINLVQNWRTDGFAKSLLNCSN